MSGLLDCEYGCTGILTIDGFSLNCPAWDIPSLARLWFDADTRGENKELPGSQGRRPYPTRLDQTVVDLPFVVHGDLDQTGAAIANPMIGLQAHLDTLWTNVFAPVTSGTGTRPAELTMPDGSTRTARVQFEPLDASGDIYDFRFVEFVIHMTIVDGRFV